MKRAVSLAKAASEAVAKKTAASVPAADKPAEAAAGKPVEAAAPAAAGFLSADGDLDVDMFQMRFGLGIGFAPHRFAADKEADVWVFTRYLPVGQDGEIQRLQQADGIGEVGLRDRKSVV